MNSDSLKQYQAFLKRLQNNTGVDIIDASGKLVVRNQQIQRTFRHVMKFMQNINNETPQLASVVRNPYTEQIELIIVPPAAAHNIYGATFKGYRPAYRIDTSPNIQNKASLSSHLNMIKEIEHELAMAFLFKDCQYTDKPYLGPKYSVGTESYVYIFDDRADTDLYRLQQGLNSEQRDALYIKLTKQLFAGLARIHQADYVHNDIKSNNLLFFEAQDCFKISDFSYMRKSGTPTTAGTTAFFSPQKIAYCIQKNGNPPSDVEYSYGYQIYQREPERYQGTASYHDDMWAAGVTLFELVSGELPAKMDDTSIKHIFTKYPLLAKLLQSDYMSRPAAAELLS